ncbi:thioester-forming surface-anchored protein [Streptococcus dysgalactiae]|uniref:thioester-forming surface-anchored protein n=1 Tax=Streptococcus dysgalactiae TaxID=1334 RepID=UPI0010CAC8A2|nr:thioester-forming surface-anchored protein [Streptococcus dysgalactiae]MDY2962793.1 thioester-forming surface-anchored protein [Streptococcus dysgalactiae]VTT08530.1 fibronectin-binding protein [Streptococcus dysgalactiae]
MKNIIKKLLITTAAFIVMSGSLGVGTLRVLAEQYYGWEDGTRRSSPFFLYATPQDNPKREPQNEYVVYCFNRNLHWPDLWQSGMERPGDLPLYEKMQGTTDLFKSKAYKPRSGDNIEQALVAVLSQGYPNVLSIKGLDANSSRKITQLAIWYFSDSIDHPEDVITEQLNQKEKEALYYLIGVGNNSKNHISEEKTLDLYEYKSQGYRHSGYQNLLGSTLIPKTPEKPKVPAPKKPEQPQPNTPDIDVEIVKPEIPTKPLVEPMLPLQPSIPNTPKPEIPKKEDLGIVIGGGNVVETTEDTATGSQGGAHNGVVSIQENKDPIVEETYESPLPGQSGQSGSTTEVEDTKGADVMIGGQGEIIDLEETLPTEQGQSGSTTEVEDTKGPDVMIGGQGEIVDFEETLSTEQGQSGSTSEVEDTKGPDVMIGGQGEIVEFEETLPNEHGQSGSTTEVEDSKPKISIHFDNEWPKEEKPQLPTVEKPKAKVSLPATGEAEHVLSTIVGAMILFLVSLWGLLKRKASKA